MASAFLSIVQKIIRKGNLKPHARQWRDACNRDGTGDLSSPASPTRKRSGSSAAIPPQARRNVWMAGSFWNRATSTISRRGETEYHQRNLRHPDGGPAHWPHVLQQPKSRLPVNHSKRNVAHHYDLSEKLFELFPRRGLAHSCAYWQSARHQPEWRRRSPRSGTSPPRFARAEPARVLEIGLAGAAWAMYLAESTDGVDFTGITLSARSS